MVIDLAYMFIAIGNNRRKKKRKDFNTFYYQKKKKMFKIPGDKLLVEICNLYRWSSRKMVKDIKIIYQGHSGEITLHIFIVALFFFNHQPSYATLMASLIKLFHLNPLKGLWNVVEQGRILNPCRNHDP